MCSDFVAANVPTALAGLVETALLAGRQAARCRGRNGEGPTAMRVPRIAAVTV